MFTVKINNKEITFTFSHKHFPELVEIRPKVLIKAQTTASLQVGTMTFYDWSYCSAFDNFDKDKGRKVALAKVLKLSKLDYIERSAVWGRYHNRHIDDAEYEVLSKGWNEL